MSRATRLAARLVKIQARIAEVEAQYPYVVAARQGQDNYQRFENQDMRQVHDAYMELLDQEEFLQAEIDAENGTENTDCRGAEFRRPL